MKKLSELADSGNRYATLYVQGIRDHLVSVGLSKDLQSDGTIYVMIKM